MVDLNVMQTITCWDWLVFKVLARELESEALQLTGYHCSVFAVTAFELKLAETWGTGCTNLTGLASVISAVPHGDMTLWMDPGEAWARRLSAALARACYCKGAIAYDLEYWTSSKSWK